MNAPTINTPERDRSIGAILIDAGKLSAENAERVLRLSRDENMRFGDAALQLGLVREEDIEFALARQFNYSYLSRSDHSIAAEVIAAFSPDAPAVEQLRALRTQLMLRWFDKEASRTAVAIVSPGRGDGRSWLAANLAVVFSQLGERTLLIDADMRNARQHQLFKLDNRLGLSALLSGRAQQDVIKRIAPLRGLSVLPAGSEPPNPQELLSQPAFGDLLANLSGNFDVIIIDTPVASPFADAQTLAAKAGGAVLLARRDHSATEQLKATLQALTEANVSVIGSVLNGI